MWLRPSTRLNSYTILSVTCFIVTSLFRLLLPSLSFNTPPTL